MSNFFTADQHIGHKAIIQFTGRPFQSVEQMDAFIVQAWNKVVSSRDNVYVLGDVCMGRGEQAEEFFKQLKGRIHIVPGGHDKRWLKYHRKHKLVSKDCLAVEVLPPLITVTLSIAHRPHPIVLCHYPLANWDRKSYGAWHLHGHSHGQYKGKGKILDVGVDCHRFSPVELDAIASYFADPSRSIDSLLPDEGCQ